MAGIYKKVTKKVKTLVAYQCDCCKKVYSDMMDTQEMLHFRNTGGYSSVFGDGSRISLDLCQDCIKARLGDIINVED